MKLDILNDFGHAKEHLDVIFIEFSLIIMIYSIEFKDH